MFFSIIIPLYNRPREIDELLLSLVYQDYKRFEVLVVDDGSALDARDIVESYRERLAIRYFFKENEGQGIARNFGIERAKGDYFIFFDSDCLIPEHYLSTVDAYLRKHPLDAFGGPDVSHKGFTDIQKAISYSMTSPITTGGIRGNKKHVGKFHPRGFNMGVSRLIWETVGGFKLARRGEDIEYSIRIQRSGFNIGLISEAFVYHKRRTDFNQFYKQLNSFGRTRIELYKLYPSELKLVHFFPAAFVALLFVTIVTNIFGLPLAVLCNALVFSYAILLFLHALITERSFKVALLSVVAAFIQLIAYGTGFLENFWKRVVS